MRSIKRKSENINDARSELIRFIKEMDIGEGNNLPSEAEMTKILNASTSALRRAILSLSRDGIIERKKGVGSKAYPSILQFEPRVESEIGFPGLIAASGGIPKLVRSALQWGYAGNGAPELGIEPDSEVAVIETMYYSNNAPVIHSVQKIDKALFKRTVEADFVGGAFDALEKYCNKKVHHGLARYFCVKAEPDLAKLMSVKEGFPLLGWKEVHYDVEDQVVCVSEIYFNTELLPMYTLRVFAGTKLD